MSRPQKEEKSWGWGEILAATAVGAVVAVGVAGAAVVSAIANNGEEKKSKLKMEARKNAFSKYESITLAVDATPKRCGGFLKLPHSRKIYFYSVDWSKFFKFPSEPDKFEMTNALLALNFFSSYILQDRDLYIEAEVKTDSTFPLSGYRRTDYYEMKREIDLVMAQIDATYKDSYRNSDDDMATADRLSRNKPVGPWPDNYKVEDVSLYVEMFINEIIQYVPCTCINTSTFRAISFNSY